MADLDTLRSLRERVIAATGSHDWSLVVALGKALDPDFPGPWPHYNESIDATVALLKRALPSARFIVHSGDDDAKASVLLPVCSSPLWQMDQSAPHSGRTPALALLAALLSALIARQEEPSDDQR